MRSGMTSRYSPPVTRSRHLLPRITASFLVLAMAAILTVDTLWWFRAQRSLDDGTRRALASIGAEHWRASARTGHRGGWPWSARLTLRDPLIDDRDGMGWTSEGVVAALSPLHPDVITLETSGTQTLRMPMLDGPAISLHVWGSRIAATWPYRVPGPTSFSADALHLALGGLGPDDAIQIAALSGSLEPTSEGLRLDVLLHDLALPALLGRAGSRVLPAARISLLLPHLVDDGTTPPSLDRWRSSGGKILVEEVAAEWEDASASASGQVTLEADGSLSGTLTLVMRDPDLIMDRMRRAGIFTAGQQLAMQAVLDVIRTGRRDGPSDPVGSTRLHLILDRSLLLLGRIPLARIPAISYSR